MKKLFSLMMCFVLTIGARAQFSGSGGGTEADPYRIYNETHLAQMANFLNQDGVVFELMKDVDLSSYISENSPSQGWTPIGVESAPFKGVLKGNDHKISGLYINRPSSSHIGLFGYIQNATISNVVLEGTKVIGGSYVGALIGYVKHSPTGKSTTIENCHVTMTSNEGIVTRTHSGGGVIGFMGGEAYASNCSYTGNVTNSSDENGGFAGGVSGVEFTNISVNGNVSGTARTGGLIGNCSGTNILKNITVKGDVSAPNDIQVAGISGHQNGSTQYTNIHYEGDITAKGQVGGIVGWIGSETHLAQCHSKGKITASTDYVGGIVGKSDGGNIANMESCSHFGDIEGKNYVGGIVGAIETTATPPDLYANYGSTSVTSNNERHGPYYDVIVSGNTLCCNISNTISVGKVIGEDYVGGLCGKDETSDGYISNQVENDTGDYNCGRLYTWSGSELTDYISTGYYSDKYTYYHNATVLSFEYVRNTVSLFYKNCYHNGLVLGNAYVGGLVGYKKGGEIIDCYANSSITGKTNVGGLVGGAEGSVVGPSIIELCMKSNIAINPTITATSSNVGRIIGNRGDAVTIGALASAEGNRALTQTKVMLCGVAQDITDDEQNGTSIGTSMLKLRGNYVSMGWNFNDDWNILETESFPYKKYQAAPPIIKSSLESQDESISGQSLNGGTVYMYYKDREPVSTTSVGNNWTFNTEKLQSGAQVQLYADVEGMTPSYFATSIVKYPGSGTEDDPYRIYTAEDLQGASNSGYYKLMNDIDLTTWINENSPTKGWQAIGRNSSVATYIDGDGHKVTGLWIDSTEGYNGLFSNYSAGYIKNLNVEVATGKKVKGGDYTGILIGRMANGDIINCNIKGEVEGTVHVGGVTGYMENGTLESNTFDGHVSNAFANSYVGGITGHAKNVVTISNAAVAAISAQGVSTRVGGLIGYAENGSISKSNANTEITATGANNYVGGLVGRIAAPIDQCFSTGTVTASGNGSYTAGLVGYANANVSNSYSIANVNGTEYVAGLVAYTYKGIDKCYAKGDVNGVQYGGGLVAELDGSDAKVTNSVAANNILSLTSQSAWGCRVVGGFKNGALEPILGSNLALSTMQVSLNNVPMKKTDDNIEGVAKTETELKSAATYTALGWDMTDTWGVFELNSYPYLKWEKTTPTQPEGGETGGVSTADYAMSITPVYSASGTSVNLSVCMTNKNDINGFQFDIVLPEGVTAQKGSRGKYVFNLGERGDDHTFSSTLKEDGSIRVICTSMSNAIFTGNSGEVCQIPVDLAEDLVNGTYVVTLKNVSLSDTESTDIQASDVEGKITILNDYFEMGTASGSIGKTITLPVAMKNKSANICGFQCDIVMPEGFSIATSDKGKYLLSVTERGDDHSFSALDRGNNTVRVVCTSLTNATFTGAEGDLFEISLTTERTVEAGEYEIKLTNISLSNTASLDIPVADCVGTVTLKKYTPGDVNNDEKISVADVTAAISFVLGNESPSFIREAADMDANDEVKVNDVTAIISLVLNNDVANAKSMSRMMAKRMASAMNDSKLYIEPFSIAPGEEKYIDLVLDNPNLESIGWQADVELPAGLSFVTNDKGKFVSKINEARTDGYSISSDRVKGSDNAVRFIGVSMENFSIEGTSGAIMSILVKADENLAEGEYVGYLTNVSLSDVQSNDVPVADSDFTATVATEKIDYAEGYSLVIKPFKAASGSAYTLTMDMNCATEDVTAMEFDIVAPEILARTKSGRANKAPAFANDDRIYVDDHSIDMTADGHVTIDAIVADEYRMIAGTSGSLVNFYYTANAGIKEGIYQIEINNIKMTLDDGTVLDVKPYKADVYVGTPTAELDNGCVAFHGDYSTTATYSMLTAAMPQEGVNTVDMTSVTALPKNTTVATDGVLVYTSEDLRIKNTKNVVIGESCENLVLNDNFSFAAPKAFTAVSASYNATVSASLGYKTLVLPYDCAVPAGFEAYEVGSVTGNTLNMEPVNTIAANKPVILKNAGTAKMEAMNVTINATNGETYTDGVLVGTYKTINAPVGSYVLQNQEGNVAFYCVGETVQPVVNPFRAYLQLTSQKAKVVNLNFGDDVTSINLETGMPVDGDIYNANGVRTAKMHRGVNIVRTGKGVMKVLK